MDIIGTVYVLRCKQNKLYVGHTMDLENRLNVHIMGGDRCPVWTRTYHPIDPIPFSAELGTKRDENRKTLQLMLEYGWENIARGQWCQKNMLIPPEFLRLANGENLDTILDDCEFYNDMCYRCRRTSHFWIDCHATIDIDGNVLY